MNWQERAEQAEARVKELEQGKGGPFVTLEFHEQVQARLARVEKALRKADALLLMLGHDYPGLLELRAALGEPQP